MSKLKKEERMAYEASLKAKWDTQNAFDYAMKQAAEQAAKEAAKETEEKTRKEERAKVEADKLLSAKSLKQSGVSIHVIAESLKLPIEVAEKL